MATLMPFSVLDVLTRAAALVEADQVPSEPHHGAFCPWCAIACAKTALDREYATEAPLGTALEAVLMMARGQRPVLDLPTDVPLKDAYEALRPWKDRFADSIDKAECLTILRTALAGVQKTEVH